MNNTNNKKLPKRFKRSPSNCKICEAPALYSYFGAVVCNSCKMFFKRNAIQSVTPECKFNKHCKINQSNRHVCAPCRLAKCFESGMQAELFRASRFNKTKSKNKNVLAMDQVPQLPTLSLLRSDKSTLTRGQWDLISNIAHCYDEYSGLSMTQRFAQEQKELPFKMRFKLAAVGELFTSLGNQSQFVFEKNMNFILLNQNDRSILLRSAVKYVGGISILFIMRCVGLLDDAKFYKNAEVIYGPDALKNAIRATSQIDIDSVFMKLALGMIMFSTFDYVRHSKDPPINLMNPQQVLSIQNIYADVSWRYLVYKYGYERAVIYFSNFIRYLFSINASLVAALEVQYYNDQLDSLIEKTEKSLKMRE